MANNEQKSCDDCQHNIRKYADGYIFRNWSGRFEGDPNTLPVVPDQSKFWTYWECKKNVKKILHLNIDGKCSAFQQIKAK